MKDPIETTDIFKAASLLCSNSQLTNVKLIDKDTVLFELEGENISRIEANYTNGRLLVNPLEFRGKLNMLRDLMFSRLKQGHEIANEPRLTLVRH